MTVEWKVFLGVSARVSHYIEGLAGRRPGGPASSPTPASTEEGTSRHRRLGLPRCTGMDAAVLFHVDLTPPSNPLCDDKSAKWSAAPRSIWRRATPGGATNEGPSDGRGPPLF